MNNFEKWKADLTPEKLFKLIDTIGFCVICPAWSICEKHEADTCKGVFMTWANQEAGNDQLR